MPSASSGLYLSRVLCPFFLRESSAEHKIVCEGPDFWSSVSLNYSGNLENKRRHHLETYCCTMRYKECRVCRLISNPKYDEEE